MLELRLSGQTVSEPVYPSEVYHVNLVCKATLNGNKHYFEAEGVTGYIEFAVNSVWVTVTESKNEHVACMSYLFDYSETR